MRLSPTHAELRLWNRLRDRQLGVRFRRQQAIDRFVVDFYCREARLAVEIDGGIHGERVARDLDRDLILRAQGLRILHFHNEEVESSLDDVIARIEAFLLNAANC